MRFANLALQGFSLIGIEARQHIGLDPGQAVFERRRQLLQILAAIAALDLLRKSGGFLMSYEELDDTAGTVYEGI